MNCHQICEILLEEKDAAPARRLAARKHVAACSSCAQFLAQLRVLREAAANDGASGTPAPATLKAILDAGRHHLQQPQRRHFHIPTQTLAWAAGLLAMAGAALLLLPAAAPQSGMQYIDSVIALLDESSPATADPVSVTATEEEKIRALSVRLLKLQGFEDDAAFSDDILTQEFESLPPRETQGHKSAAVPVRKHV